MSLLVAISHVVVCSISMCLNEHVFDHGFYGFQIYFAFYFTIPPIIGLCAVCLHNVELAHWYCMMSASGICLSIPSIITSAYYIVLADSLRQYYQIRQAEENLTNWILTAPIICLICSFLTLCLSVISFLVVYLRSRQFIPSHQNSFRKSRK